MSAILETVEHEAIRPEPLPDPVIQLTGECRAKSGPEIADSSRLTYWKGFAGSQTVSEVEPLATPGAGVTDAATEVGR